MSLFSFFKKTDKTGTDSTIDSSELLEAVEGSSDEEVITPLSYHPDWNVPQEQKYVFNFLANELSPLKPNQISLSGIDIDVDFQTDDWVVKAFFRSSLEKPVQMGMTELLLLDGDNRVLAAKEFNFEELGEIPPRSARPWVFQFEKPFRAEIEVPKDGWTLAFNVQSLVPHQMELESTWEEALKDEQKDALKKIVEQLPKLKSQEVNISGFQIQPQQNGDIAVSLFVRNGHSKHINIEQLPLELYDVTKELVASGTFKMNDFTVRANTSKPWTFLFPKDMVTKENPDFTKWLVKIPNQQ